MPSKTNIIRLWISAAIGELFDKGYLLNDLDWDVKGNKYTLRIRGADSRPMVAVGIITFTGISDNVVLTNAVTGQKTSIKIDVESDKNQSDFLNNICNFAQQLREEAAYK